MLKVVVLICSIHTPAAQCTDDTAEDRLIGPMVSMPQQCGAAAEFLISGSHPINLKKQWFRIDCRRQG